MKIQDAVPRPCSAIYANDTPPRAYLFEIIAAGNIFYSIQQKLFVDSENSVDASLLLILFRSSDLFFNKSPCYRIVQSFVFFAHYESPAKSTNLF